MNNETVFPPIHTNANGFCLAYLNAFTWLQKQPDQFGQFVSVNAVNSFALAQLLILFVPAAFQAFVGVFEVCMPKTSTTSSLFSGHRIFEAIVYLIFGIWDAIYIFQGSGDPRFMYQNVPALLWLAVCLALIVNSLYIATALHHKAPWFERVIDFNFMLIAVLLIGQFEGTHLSSILNMVAGLLVLLSVTLSPHAQRFINVKSNDRSLSQRLASSLIYFLQLAAWICVCVSYHKSPVEWIVQHSQACPVEIGAYVLYALFSAEFVGVLIAYAVYHLSSKSSETPFELAERQPFLVSSSATNWGPGYDRGANAPHPRRR